MKRGWEEVDNTITINGYHVAKTWLHRERGLVRIFWDDPYVSESFCRLETFWMEDDTVYSSKTGAEVPGDVEDYVRWVLTEYE